MSIWNTLLLGSLGFSLGGPLGALLGAAIGRSLDKKRQAFRQTGYGGQEGRQNIFAMATIVLGAKLAKADGRVTEDEVSAFREKMRIPESQIQMVGKIWNQAAKESAGFEPYAQQLASMFQNNKAVLEELLNTLFYIAEADGTVSKPEVEMISRLAQIFGFDQATFERIHSSREGSGKMNPYKVLGISSSANDSEVKKRWMQLVKDNHPDKLVAEGVPKEFIENANKKVAVINAAYQQIKKQRNIN